MVSADETSADNVEKEYTKQYMTIPRLGFHLNAMLKSIWLLYQHLRGNLFVSADEIGTDCFEKRT